MKEIHNHGFWNAETAHIHHAHSPELATWMTNWFKTKIATDTPIYDFGCGLGLYLKHFSTQGYTNLRGYEGEPPVRKEFENIVQQDLTIPFQVNPKGLCVFLEVAEHIPENLCEIAVQNVINACDKYLILSWAIRGQAGFGHVNCLDNHEVIEKFEKLGFKYLEQDSLSARSVITNKTAWFKNTILIFEKI